VDGNATVTRIGADEFAFLLPMTFSEDAALERARMLIEVLSAPYDVGERMARLSASVGCSLSAFRRRHDRSPAVEGGIGALSRQAFGPRRRHRLHARDGGGGQAVTRIEQALRRAVAASEVEPYFQPIVDLETRRIIGFEALARWTIPISAPISPAVFIPIAEDRGIIGQLSQLLLRKAAEAARTWPDELFLSFNLSPSQLVDQNTGSQILSTFSR
jgi:predicted signal transduction protein with EAL and GGDEF domain